MEIEVRKIKNGYTLNYWIPVRNSANTSDERVTIYCADLAAVQVELTSLFAFA